MKILIAGLGSIGQRHARNLRSLLGEGVELLAYRVRGLPHVISETMTIEASSSVEHRYGIRAFADLDTALTERPSAVIVCNPTRFHVPTAMRAIDAGCHVLIEKPLSDSDEQVDALIACASRRGLVAAVGYQMRFHPALLRLRELLEGGCIGRVLGVRAEWGEYLPDAHPYEDYRRSYAARADLGGGVILCYIHEFDYLTWLFGEPRRVSTTGGRSGVLDVEVEDHATTTMVSTVDGQEVTVELLQSFAQRPASRSCVVRGAAGSITVDLMTPRLEIRSSADAVIGCETFDGFHRNDLFIDEMKNFLAAIDGGAAAVPVSEGAISLRVALAAKQSLRTGKGVEWS